MCVCDDAVIWLTFSIVYIRKIDQQPPGQPPHNRIIQIKRPIGRADDDDAFILVGNGGTESVHFLHELGEDEVV